MRISIHDATAIKAGPVRRLGDVGTWCRTLTIRSADGPAAEAEVTVYAEDPAALLLPGEALREALAAVA